MTFLYFTESLISIFAPNGIFNTAGSKFIKYGGVFLECKWEFNLCTKVVLPLPAIPIHIIVGGGVGIVWWFVVYNIGDGFKSKRRREWLILYFFFFGSAMFCSHTLEGYREYDGDGDDDDY